MRLIDADELIKTLKSNCKPELCHDYKNAWCEACCPYNNFEDLIDNAPTIEPFEKVGAICNENCGMTRPHGKWIAVKDKLPDTDGEYLVSLDNGRIVVADQRGIIENHDFEPKMMAWQPLPEPYRTIKLNCDENMILRLTERR